MRINNDDPRLTAYVLGELEEPDRVDIETAIEKSVELQNEVSEIRKTVGMLEQVLTVGDAALNPEQIQRIESALEPPASQRGAAAYGFWLKIAALLFLLVGLPLLLGPLVLNRLARSEDPLVAERSRQELSATSTVGSARKEGLLNSESPAKIAANRDDRGSKEIPTDQRQGPAAGRPAPEDGQGRDPNEVAKRQADESMSSVPTALPTPVTRVEADRSPSEVSQLPKAQEPVGGVLIGRVPEGPTPDYAPIQGRKPIDLLVLTEGVSQTTAPVASSGALQIGGVPSPTPFAPEANSASYKGDDVSFRPPQAFNTEGYDRIVENEFRRVLDDPLSTFSIDVDTASYSNVRRFIQQGTLPPPDAVRIEELVNYFNYEYPQPIGPHPFSVNLEASAAPWKPEHRLIRIGLKGRELQGDRPAGNLVFLLDVSGSMSPPNKLPLLRQAMKLLVDRMRPQDRIAIVVYAGASGLVLPSTGGSRKAQILAALDQLEAGGSTNGAAGIELAYSVAESNRIEGGVNRVILATDGDFNVGATDRGSLSRLIEDKARKGVFLSVLGFGMGNLKDSSLEQLADKGNGNYGYIDTLREARKLLVEQMDGTLVTIAKDVKIQVEFNPSRVAAYRLIGYENRALANQDFNDDKKDAGEIGAGHTVTALYEIVPAGGPIPTAGVDSLKYQEPLQKLSSAAQSGELLTVKLRYKNPEGDTSQLLQVPFVDEGQTWPAASRDFKFAAAVASFGMILRGSPHRGQATLGSVLELAQESGTLDAQGYRSEFLEIVRAAQRLRAQ